MNEGPFELPEHWEWTTLGAICSKPQYGYTTKASKVAHGPKFLRTTDLNRGGVNWDTVPYCEEPPVDPPKYAVHDGDILIARAGSVGKAYRVVNPPDAIFASYLIRFRAVQALDRYIEHFLQSSLYWDQIEESSAGITIPNVNAQKLSAIEIPLPSLDEQYRIVAKIEQLFAESRTAREALDSVPALIKRFRQSVLAKAFRGELTERDLSDEPASVLLGRIRAERQAKSKKSVEPEPPDISELPELPEGWVWATLGGVFDVSPGGTPSRKVADYWNGDIPWVSSGEVAFCRIKDTREKITQAGSDNSSAKVYPIGTVLLAMIGEGKTRGQCAILDIEAANNQNVAAIRCSKTPVPSEYLFYWLMYRYDETRGGGQGGAQPALNGERVRQLPLPLAPLAEQRRIIAKIEALFAQADAIEGAVNIARLRAQKVDQAILARAFRGEL